MRFLSSLAILIVLLVSGCSEHFPNQPLGNLPPETFLALRPDSTLRRTASQQDIHWWGEDPDGFVAGYYFSFDSTHWTFTTANDSLFGLKLNTTDTTYSFFVKAVDNEGAEDPTPASLRYPIMNTPPTVSFVLKSDVPDTTYPVASFQWVGLDIDGDETITSFWYALDDTSNPNNWKSVPGYARSVTLYKADGLVEGDHTFYLRARDVAGAWSKTIQMPDTVKRTWHVREPKGAFLIIDDYQPADAAAGYYATMFDTLTVNGRHLGSQDVWDIKKGASPTKRGDLVPALINPTFIETLKLFKYVFWYADNNPSLEIAQASLGAFTRAGGKVLFSSSFPELSSGQGGVGDFAPIDNTEPSYFTTILMSGDTLQAVDPIYPTLVRDANPTIYLFPRGLLPKVNARVIYQMQSSSRWSGQPVMGVQDGDSPSFVLMAVLLHRFGPPASAAEFFRTVFGKEFGAQ